MRTTSESVSEPQHQPCSLPESKLLSPAPTKFSFEFRDHRKQHHQVDVTDDVRLNEERREPEPKVVFQIARADVYRERLNRRSNQMLMIVYCAKTETKE